MTGYPAGEGSVSDSYDGLTFGYRAEDLSRDELLDRTVLTERERVVIQKLRASGQRLLIGPRGCGKSTYLKYAYFEGLDSQTVLPVYVNYSRSISLEPEFRRSSAALPLFRQWILANLLDGLRRSLSELDSAQAIASADIQMLDDASVLVNAVERRKLNNARETEFSIAGTLELMERALTIVGRQRIVLLLDDAAHAFSAEQQREFFDVFGSLRSRKVSAKAAVYPGVTNYISRFHVGHDAQVIDVWLDVNDPGYLHMMREVARKRLPEAVYQELERREGVIDYLALASFGLPRSFITTLTSFVENLSSRSVEPSKQLADRGVYETVDSAIKIFESLEEKLPRYKFFVQVGRELLDATVSSIKDYNDGRKNDAKTTLCLYAKPLTSEIDKILGLLEYAGLVRRGRQVRMGPDQYETVSVHYSLLLRDGALSLGRNPSITESARVLEKRPPNVWTRRQVESLLGSDYLDRCRLNLTACTVCGTAREVAEAKFCFNCGARLEEASVYDELLSAPISKLPLSDALLKRVRENSEIGIIKDVLIDDERQGLLTIPYIGPVRASRIHAAAEEFVYE